ncbi:carbohydrate deacetylase [Clostridium celatum]|uniref:carbohydrate deacetylase n=1 Tax=Clostridium celatum TaxID=36834 RepID=UPI00319E1AF5
MGKYLIINADDFGVSKSVNEAIIDLLNKNKISSATLMPNVNYYDEAAKWAVENSSNIGLHLTFLNDDTKFKYRSLSRSKSLEDENGYLLDDRRKFSKSLKLRDIKKEIDMQFKKLEDSGVKISHVDIHRYALYPTYNPIVYLYLCKKCRQKGRLPIRWSRNGEVSVCDGITNLCDTDNIAKFFSAVSDLYQIPIPDYVFKFPYRDIFFSYDEKKEAFINMLRKLPDGINEVHIHPAINSEEIKQINPTWKERVLEYSFMLDNDVTDAMKENNIELITYKDIAKINKGKSRIEAIKELFRYGINYSIKGVKSVFLRVKK